MCFQVLPLVWVIWRYGFQIFSLNDEEDQTDIAKALSVSPNNHKIFLQDVDVNLIITYYCMTGMTGYDLLRKIKMQMQPVMSKSSYMFP
ncbi:hypothetical protein ACLB2K_056050 [Fragaria x ananassa]